MSEVSRSDVNGGKVELRRALFRGDAVNKKIASGELWQGADKPTNDAIRAANAFASGVETEWREQRSPVIKQAEQSCLAGYTILADKLNRIGQIQKQRGRTKIDLSDAVALAAAFDNAAAEDSEGDDLELAENMGKYALKMHAAVGTLRDRLAELDAELKSIDAELPSLRKAADAAAEQLAALAL